MISLSDLRPYQPVVIDAARDSMRRGSRSVLVVAPTGSGKTIIACAIMQSVIRKGNRALFVADRRKLVDQAGEKLRATGIEDFGLIMADRPSNLGAPIQVASVQTLEARDYDLPHFDLVVVDEAHKSVSKRFERLLRVDHAGSRVLGLTATPVRSDGQGLGIVFDDMVLAPSVRELQRDGYLVGTQYWSPSLPDLSRVRVSQSTGDYVQSELGEVMDRDVTLVGDIVDHYRRLASDRQAVVFATTVGHSKTIAAAFNVAGIRAEHLDGSTADYYRQGIYGRVSSGETRVVVNCQVLTEGWDEPAISACILAKPTKSLGAYLQMAGRVLRPAEGKRDAMIIDHSGTVRDLGLIEDEHLWDLHDTRRDARRKKEVRDEVRPVVCPECGFTFRAEPRCPQCGWRSSGPAARELYLTRDELEFIESRPQRELEEAQRSFYRRMLGLAAKRGRPVVWARGLFRHKYKFVPDWDVGPLEPDAEAYRWEKHVQIKEARGRHAFVGGRSSGVRKGYSQGRLPYKDEG